MSDFEVEMTCSARLANRSAKILGVLVLLFVVGCGEDAELGGSLEESYDLSFDFVRARLYPTELSIEYVREDGEIAVGLTVRTMDTGLSGPATIDLARFGWVTGSAAGNPMPSFLSGTLVLRAFAREDGVPVEGTFDVLLEGTRGDLTLYGEFSTTLDIVQ